MTKRTETKIKETSGQTKKFSCLYNGTIVFVLRFIEAKKKKIK